MSEDTDPEIQIFISYSREDIKAVEKALDALRDALKREGWKAWIDRTHIAYGHEFDASIERAISESRFMVALLSHRSARPEGFCRNEWLYALHKNKTIIPVRIEAVDPPISILRLQYIDAVDDSVSIAELVCNAIRTLWQGKTEEALPAQKKAENDPDDFRKEIMGKVLPFQWLKADKGESWWRDLSDLSFDEELSKYGGRFFGLGELFDDLNDWVDNGEETAKVLVAPSGAGKSAIAAQCTARLDARMVHFCSASKFRSCEPSAWIRSLVYQLSAQFPKYAEIVREKKNPPWDSPSAVFRQLVSEPLNSPTLRGSLISAENPWVIVIDSLDEAVSVSKVGREFVNELVGALEVFPDGLKLIATTRPNEEYLDFLKRSEVAVCRIDEDYDLRKAVDSMIAYRLDALGHTFTGERRKMLSEQLAKSAAGNFQFAEIVLEGLSDEISRKQIESALEDDSSLIPGELEGIYSKMFEARYKESEYKKDIAPLTNCLVAAHAPLPEELLIESSGLPDDEAARNLVKLTQFLRKDDENLQFTHASIRDWLQQSPIFVTRQKTGHGLLSDRCWSIRSRTGHVGHAYAKRHLSSHLIGADTPKRWERLAQLIGKDLRAHERIRASLRQSDFSDVKTWPDEFRDELDSIDSFNSLFFIGEAYDMIGQQADAIRTYTRLCEVTEDTVNDEYCMARNRLAVAYDRDRQMEKAIDVLEKLLAIPDAKRKFRNIYYWWARYQYGVVLVRMDLYQEARSHLEAVQTQSEDDRHRVSAIHQLGVICLKQKQFDQAEEMFKEAIAGRDKLGYEHRLAFEYRRLGQVYARTEKLQEADEAFARALEISNDFGNQRYVEKIMEDLAKYMPPDWTGEA